jgi:spermidine/putrescine-binding protein
MSEVVRYIALSVLRDDEIFFKEQVLSWLDTILLAHKKQNHCTLAYRYLQEAIDAHIPPDQKALIQPYFQCVITTLTSHVA